MVNIFHTHYAPDNDDYGHLLLATKAVGIERYVIDVELRYLESLPSKDPSLKV